MKNRRRENIHFDLVLGYVTAAVMHALWLHTNFTDIKKHMYLTTCVKPLHY